MYKKNVGKIWNKIKKFLTQWSSLGLFFGFILFGISLSPSLVPRPFMLQGVVSGLVLTLGYGLGFSIMGIWRFMQLPELTGKTLRWAQLVLGIFVSTLVIYFFANTVYWQNSVRSLMDMDPIDETATIRIILVALLLWVFTIYLAIGVRKLYTLSVKKIHNIIPRRISYVIGSALLTFILFFLVNGLLVSKVIDFADDMYAKVDQAIPGDLTAPEKPTRSGSPDSFVAWDELGREGKYFVTGGPNKEKIARTTNKPSQEPIRLYVGLSAAPTPEQQAELALAELKRSKSFERKKIVIATPTGTGWIDDGAVDSFEYLHGGDTSIVAVQYSYLSSPVTLILDPDRARISARAVFNTVYGYWKTLPKESRPELYIYGLSLGSLGSEDSAQIYSLLSDPISGALWAGPPFANSFWPAVIKGRNPGSPAYLPALEKGELVRVLNASETEVSEFSEWGPLKIVYLAHPSDAIVFFSPSLWYKEPDWLSQERGEDVSSYLKWYPFVTFFQVGLDMLVTTDVPYGHGHNYAPVDYMRAWMEFEDKSQWTKSEIQNIQKNLGLGSLNRD